MYTTNLYNGMQQYSVVITNITLIDYALLISFSGFRYEIFLSNFRGNVFSSIRLMVYCRYISDIRRIRRQLDHVTNIGISRVRIRQL